MMPDFLLASLSIDNPVCHISLSDAHGVVAQGCIIEWILLKTDNKINSFKNLIF